MTPKEAREKREAIIDSLTEKWHARDSYSCPKAVDARILAWQMMDLSREAFRKRGWIS